MGVVPKSIVFTAKKMRFEQLLEISQEYVKGLYKSQGIKPVKVITADPLTPEQKAAVTEKMKVKAKARDIKLKCVTDGGIMGGMRIEWDFLDPDQLICPCMVID